MDSEFLQQKFERCRKELLTARNKRERPLLDNKMLLGWNALMNTACSKAYTATGNEHYRQLAVDNMQFLLGNLSAGENVFFHTYSEGKAKFTAFLDDYTFLVQALIQLQEVTGDSHYLVRAR